MSDNNRGICEGCTLGQEKLGALRGSQAIVAAEATVHEVQLQIITEDFSRRNPPQRDNAEFIAATGCRYMRLRVDRVAELTVECNKKGPGFLRSCGARIVDADGNVVYAKRP